MKEFLFISLVILGWFVFLIIISSLAKLIGLHSSTNDEKTNYISSSQNTNSCSDDSYTINPASGSPMIGGIGGIDTFGNSFGACSNSCDD